MTEQITYKPLEEIADVIDSAHKTPIYSDSGYPMVRATDIKGGILRLEDTKRVDKATFEEFSKNYKSSKGDILITRVGSYGQFSYVDSNEVFCLGQNTAGIKPIIDSRYLYFCLLSPFVKNQIEQCVVGSTQKTLSLGHIRKLKIPVFKDSEIKAIAKILSSLDDKIELNRQMNATLEAMARSVFKAWFVDFEPVRANSENRPPQSASPEIAKLFPSEFENDIPKGWKDVTIGEIVFVQNGYAFKSSDFKESGTNKVIKIKNISNYQVDVINTQFIDESVSNKIDKKFKISSNDLLIAMTGAEVGKVGLVPKIDAEIWLNQRVGLFREKVNNAKWFAYLVLSNDETRNNLLGAASGSAQPNISASQIERTSSIIPTDNLIEKFGELVNPIFEKICESRFENQKLAEIRDSLLPRLISGKIRVGEAESEIANAV